LNGFKFNANVDVNKNYDADIQWDGQVSGLPFNAEYKVEAFGEMKIENLDVDISTHILGRPYDLSTTIQTHNSVIEFIDSASNIQLTDQLSISSTYDHHD
jgi:outer membrane cobalamin receptor